MIDQCAALALPPARATARTGRCPSSTSRAAEVAAWRDRRGLTADGRAGGRARARARSGPRSAGRPPPTPRSRAASRPRASRSGCSAARTRNRSRRDHRRAAGARDLTGTDLRDAILALAAAVGRGLERFGLLHVAAALGTPAIGIFGPTSPWHWAPLNPIAAAMQTTGELPCRPCHKPICRLGHHRCMRDIVPEEVLAATRRALAAVAAQDEFASRNNAAFIKSE